MYIIVRNGNVVETWRKDALRHYLADHDITSFRVFKVEEQNSEDFLMTDKEKVQLEIDRLQAKHDVEMEKLKSKLAHTSEG